MIAAVTLALLMQQLPVQQQPVRGTVVDAMTGSPVVAALVSIRDVTTRTDADGAFSIMVARGDTVRVRRIGYRATQAVVESDAIIVRMVPAATVLSSMRITDSAARGRLSAHRSVSAFVEQGALSTATAIGAMPFVSARSARGETSLTLRGSRPEQVLVTLDGMPLNDPATGRADVSDIPLSALGGISVTPGSSASAHGSGASGGVVALTSGDGSSASIAATSLNGVSAEGAFATTLGSARLRVGAGGSSARNDFRFLNDAGATDTVERRVNADERRAAMFGSAFLGTVQIIALYSARERGLGGAKNVRAYDEARELSDRRFARIRIGSDRWLASAGVRRLALSYRDRAPELASDAFGTTVDADVETSAGSFTLRAGAARDQVWGTRLPSTKRPSTFVSAATQPAIANWHSDVSVRFDAIEGSTGHVSPALAIERHGRLRPFIRVAQGFRLPTFYDLYAPSPLGFVATGVNPERVVLDAEAGVRIAGQVSRLSVSVFERRTHDAVVWFPGNFNWSPKNVARERVRGAEAVASHSAGRFSSEWWGAAYDTRLYTDGLAIPTPYVPKLAGGASLRLSVERLVISSSLSARGRRPFAIAAPSRSLELPGALIVDLNASYRVPASNGATVISAGVLNIGNVSSESVRRFPSPGRVWQAAVTVHP